MKYLLLSAAALFASGLTFFTGFGLGTLLLPVFTLFLPVNVAVAATAVVHLLNSVFRVVLVGQRASLAAVLRFGIPAIVAAYLGARALGWLSHLQPLFRYTLAGHPLEVTPLKLVIAVLMGVFAFLEAWPKWNRVSVSLKYLPLGGLLSGFFGGVSGHQGAFRAIFLLRTGLSKEEFVATTAVIATLVDLSRLVVYRSWLTKAVLAENGPLVLAATAAALTGTLAGSRLLAKVTIREIQIIVAVMLAVIAVALGIGVL